MSAGLLSVELAYARPERQWSLRLDVPAGSTLLEVVQRSGLLRDCPELCGTDGGLDLQHHRLGVFGRLREAGSEVQGGDRVEIYRPLLADPKEVRRERAARERRR